MKVFDSKTLLDIIAKQTKEIESLKHKNKIEIQYLKDVIDNLPGSVYWKNKEGVYLGHNRFAVEKMRSVNLSASIIGKTDYDLFEKSVADKFRENDLDVMTHDKVMSMEEITILANGKKVTQLSVKKPLHDETGRVIGIVGNTVDITHLKEIEEELVKAKEKAETSDALKTEFIRNIEHDIRTPFSGIYSLASILARKEIDSQKKEFLIAIKSSAKELLDYCNDIIELVHTQKGIQPITNKEFNLQELIQKVINMETPPAIHKKLELIVDYPNDMPIFFISDPYRLERILINLTSNAIKFTSIGYVKISCKVLNMNSIEKNATISISIEDTGIGIPLEMQDYIFENFVRLTPSSQSIYKGSGLGLSVVKNLVRELKGEIKLKSQPDKGSIFTFYLPVQLTLA